MAIDPISTPVPAAGPVATPTEAPQPKSKVAFCAEEKPDEFVSEVKKAKNAGILATVVSAGGLIVSGLMLKKASKMAKVAEEAGKMMEESKKFTEPLKKLYSDLGLDKAVNVMAQAFKTVCEKGGEGVKGLSVTLKKLNAETDPVKIAEINKQLNKEIGDIIISATKDLDEKAAKDAAEFAKSPTADLLTAIMTKKMGGSLPQSFEAEFKKAVLEGKIAQSPEIKAFIKAMDEVTPTE